MRDLNARVADLLDLLEESKQSGSDM
jgi:hypothetical protein